MMRRRRGERPDVPSTAGLSAVARVVVRRLGIRRPARRLLRQFFHGRPVAGGYPECAVTALGQHRRGPGQGRAHPAVVGKRERGGGRAVHAQCRRDGAGGIQQPRSPAPGEGRRRQRARRAAGRAAGARRRRRDHSGAAVRAHGRPGRAGGAGARRSGDRVLDRRQCGRPRRLSLELSAGVRRRSHRRLRREPGQTIVRRARSGQRLRHRGRGGVQAVGGAPRRPRRRARALSARPRADAGPGAQCRAGGELGRMPSSFPMEPRPCPRWCRR